MTYSEAVLERLKTEAQLAANAGDKPILERSFRLAIAEIESLSDALWEYGEHRKSCRISAGKECDCGFFTLLQSHPGQSGSEK